EGSIFIWQKDQFSIGIDKTIKDHKINGFTGFWGRANIMINKNNSESELIMFNDKFFSKCGL
ncbi:hypothetical protein, partial [Legionella pneumophila]|uniref:hypothetical protein n=1 Tax=Legionella pneumophila TaxID=446 RepID=UPI001F41F575